MLIELTHWIGFSSFVTHDFHVGFAQITNLYTNIRVITQDNGDFLQFTMLTLFVNEFPGLNGWLIKLTQLLGNFLSFKWKDIKKNLFSSSFHLSNRFGNNTE